MAIDVDIGRLRLAAAARPVFGSAGFTIMALAAMISTLSALNAGLYGSTNVTYVLAKEGELPEAFDRSVLVVAHPDDEVLWFGSVLEGVERVIMVYRDYQDWTLVPLIMRAMKNELAERMTFSFLARASDGRSRV